MRTSTTQSRNCNRTFGTPSVIKTLGDASTGHIVFFNPLTQTLDFTKSNNPSMFASITPLFNPSAPSTVRRRIIAKRIGIAIQRMLRRWLASQNFQKLSVRFKQELNAFCSISVVAFIIRIFTSGFSRMIGSIFYRIAIRCGFSSSGRTNAVQFSKYTSTRSCWITGLRYISSGDNFPRATITTTKPRTFRLSARNSTSCITDNQQTSETLSTQISDAFIHIGTHGIFRNSHVVQSSILNNVIGVVGRVLVSPQSAFILA